MGYPHRSNEYFYKWKLAHNKLFATIYDKFGTKNSTEYRILQMRGLFWWGRFVVNSSKIFIIIFKFVMGSKQMK
jgi:hypothetical protein